MPLRRPAPTVLLALSVLLSGLVAGALTGPTPSAGAAPRKPRPDLVVAAASAPATVRAGAQLSVTTTVRNRGKAAAGRSVTRLALSTDGRVGRDRALTPTRGVARLRPGRSARSTTTVVVPASTAPGRYWVVACADATRQVRESVESTASNCRVTKPVTVTALPSSHALIDADLAAGRLSEEQALQYRVFADFGDRRLPGRYVGRPDGLGEGALEDAAVGWDGLSSSAQETLRPFLVPPFYAGSHWSPVPADLAGTPGTAGAARRLDSPWCSGGTDLQPLFETWEHVDSSDGSVRIWWLRKNTGDVTLAADLLAQLEGKILPALTALMGRGPQGDGGGLCDGGSDAFDIALVDASTATVYPDGACDGDGTSAHMLFPRSAASVGWKGLHPYLAHEVMHAIQFASPVAGGGCARYGWLREMTAEWVQDYVTDPAYGIGLGPDDTEHQAAPIFLQNTEVSFEVPSPPTHHDYSDYLLALWAARKSGPHFVKDVWDAAAGAGPKEAVDAALPGGFEATWADFALSNWNRGPVRDYRDWDGLTAGAAIGGNIPVGITAPQTAEVPVAHLAAQYVRVDLNPKIKQLRIRHDKAGDPKHVVRAILTYSDGSHDVVTLDKAENVLCIDDGTKKVTELVLVLSNADLSADTDFPLELVGETVCGCPDATTGGNPLAGGAAAAAPAPVCRGEGNITWTYSDVYSNDEWDVNEQQSGSLRLVLADDGDGGYENAPGSSYSVSTRSTSKFYRHAPNNCGDESAVVTSNGSGALPPESAFAVVWEDGDLWLNHLVSMPTRWVFDNEVTCLGPQHDERDWIEILPECEPRAPGTPADLFYEFEETAPESGVFTFTCSGRVEYTDSSGRDHVETATVTGTLALPE